MPKEKLPVKKTKQLDKPAKRARRSFFKKRRKENIPRYNNGFSYEDLMNLESQWGGTLFGPIPAGHQRKFFEHKKNVWIWYEGWTDVSGVSRDISIRYEVRPSGVFKRVAGEKYQKLEGEELENFRLAAKNYLKLMKSKLYY